jgi:flagellar biosynthetic protein FlhB
MAESSGEKSFEATAHRREQAREQGQVAYSQDLGSAVLLLVGGFLMLMLGSQIVEFCIGLMRRDLSELRALSVDPGAMMVHWHAIMMGLAVVVFPLLGYLVLGAVLSNLLQVGFFWLPDRIMPDFSRVNPAAGFGRIFSLTGTMRLGFGLVKVVIVSVVAGMVLWARKDDILRSSALDIVQLGYFIADISLKTVLWVALALAILALLDYGLQRWKHEQDLKMTHQEIREEMKELQGDPHVAARRRQIQRQMVTSRISSAVPKADVIVTNPTELAVAIQYDPTEMAAPIVVAKGAGVLAQRIRRMGLEHNIPIVERKPLAQLLYKDVDIGKPVPTDAYAAVAEVLAYVYQLKGKKIPVPPKVA